MSESELLLFNIGNSSVLLFALKDDLKQDGYKKWKGA